MADQSERLAKKNPGGKGRTGVGGETRRRRIDDIVDRAQRGESDIEKQARKGGEKRRD